MENLNEEQQWILAALSNGPKYGEEISAWVKERSKGKVNLAAETLYANIAKLLALELVQRAGEQETAPGETRVTYKNTGGME